jgi:hypothetical protein
VTAAPNSQWSPETATRMSETSIGSAAECTRSH